MTSIQDLIHFGRERGASDLHLEPSSPSVFRIRGDLQAVGEVWAAEALQQLAKQLLGNHHWNDFLENKSTDLSKTISGARCRINCYQTVRGTALAIRILSSFRNNLRDNNLHPDLKKLTQHTTGLILVSGPTGSGKSTTLASLIEELNGSGKSNIITLESPIEYFFQNKKSYIRQREIPLHSPSFEQAIMDSMREDPDVLVIGEMRSPEVMRLTLNAAETGHLVLATVHSSTCAEAISRLSMSFSPEIQPSIRAQIADSLVAVVCQRLVYLPSHRIQVPVLEILMASSSVKASIRSGSFSQISNAIQTGAEDGMYSFDRYQRWIDQKKDWVRPAEATPLEEQKENFVEVPTPFVRPTRPPSTTGVASASPGKRAVIPEEEASATGRIEISVDEDDLEELAKKIAREAE
jgi:twitching motility protein PilT